MTSNIAASIRTRLLNRVRTEGMAFQLFLDRYACDLPFNYAAVKHSANQHVDEFVGRHNKAPIRYD